jgi:hypothetical protein
MSGKDDDHQFIEEEEVIEGILKHLGLWNLKVRLPPNVKAPSVTISIDDSDSHFPLRPRFLLYRNSNPPSASIFSVILGESALASTISSDSCISSV